MAEAKDQVVPLRRLIVDPTKAPEAVHHFVWARQGTEFLLEVGYVDFHDAHRKVAAIRGGEEAEPIDLIVVHRFSLSRESVARLSGVTQEMMTSLQDLDKDVPDS